MNGISRNPYLVLETMPKFTLLYFYCGSVIIGLWHIIKLIMHFLWNWILQLRMQKTDKSIKDVYSSGYHDKPPQCLVDNALGRQLYVKLKVFIDHFKSI